MQFRSVLLIALLGFTASLARGKAIPPSTDAIAEFEDDIDVGSYHKGHHSGSGGAPGFASTFDDEDYDDFDEDNDDVEDVEDDLDDISEHLRRLAIRDDTFVVDAPLARRAPAPVRPKNPTTPKTKAPGQPKKNPTTPKTKAPGRTKNPALGPQNPGKVQKPPGKKPIKKDPTAKPIKKGPTAKPIKKGPTAIKAKISTSAVAKTQLAALTVRAANASAPTFQRSSFGGWATTLGCTTRETVLKRDATQVADPTSGCTVTTGKWLDPYSGTTLTLASQADVDHLVPLKDAWISGAHAWPATRLRAFANDYDGLELLTVSLGENRSKGDRSPDQWMPTSKPFHCAYLIRWVNVKTQYSLSISENEKKALTDGLAKCP